MLIYNLYYMLWTQQNELTNFDSLPKLFYII